MTRRLGSYRTAFGGTLKKLARRHAVPAGVQADTPSLDLLVTARTITRFETEDGMITLHLAALRPGATTPRNMKLYPPNAAPIHPPPTPMDPTAPTDNPPP